MSVAALFGVFPLFLYSATQATTLGSGLSAQKGLTTITPSPAGPAISMNFASLMPSAPMTGCWSPCFLISRTTLPPSL